MITCVISLVNCQYCMHRSKQCVRPTFQHLLYLDPDSLPADLQPQGVKDAMISHDLLGSPIDYELEPAREPN